AGADIESKWLVWAARLNRKSRPLSRCPIMWPPRISAIFTSTRSQISIIFAGLPPYSGIMLSIIRTLAPRPRRRRANAEPIKPIPPVITTPAPEKTSRRGSEHELIIFRAQELHRDVLPSVFGPPDR